MSEDSVEAKSVHPDWEAVRSRLRQSHPTFFELEAGGALLMDLGSDGWLLELTPDGRLLCQMGMDIEDIMSLMSSMSMPSWQRDRKSTRRNSSHLVISYADFCLQKKKQTSIDRSNTQPMP